MSTRSHITFEQKKRLLSFLRQQPPELLLGKITEQYTMQDYQRMWQKAANICNAMPNGARKTWRQWRKSWHDLRSKAKKRNESNAEVQELSPAEQEVLGIKNVSSTTPQDQDGGSTAHEQETLEPEIYFEVEASNHESENSEQYPETKVFNKPQVRIRKLAKSSLKPSRSHECEFNCESLALQEMKKIKIKEDYVQYRKDYLAQKLRFMKLQTEALYAIAQNLSAK